MKKMLSSASFPEGARSLDYVALSEVNQAIAGKRIIAVEYVNECTVKFVLDDNSSVSLTPSGTEGDDIEVTLETAN